MAISQECNKFRLSVSICVIMSVSARDDGQTDTWTRMCILYGTFIAADSDDGYKKFQKFIQKNISKIYVRAIVIVHDENNVTILTFEIDFIELRG